MTADVQRKPAATPPESPAVTAAERYWTQTRLPWPSLLFLLPWLAIYEAGLLWAGRDAEAIRNGADSWMRAGLSQLGFGQALLLPGLLVVGLLAWHLVEKHPWRTSLETLAGMFAESLLFAFLLIVIGQSQSLLFQQVGSWMPLAVETPPTVERTDATARLLTFVGAGIYEETLFRLCLLPACYGGFRLLKSTKPWAAALAIVSTSLLFSLAHHVGAGVEPPTFFGFTFRAVAGGIFAVLFWFRGFGITVGCHAAYDVLVGVLMELRD